MPTDARTLTIDAPTPLAAMRANPFSTTHLALRGLLAVLTKVLGTAALLARIAAASMIAKAAAATDFAAAALSAVVAYRARLRFACSGIARLCARRNSFCLSFALAFALFDAFTVVAIVVFGDFGFALVAPMAHTPMLADVVAVAYFAIQSSLAVRAGAVGEAFDA